jgi:hypothetical protein
MGGWPARATKWLDASSLLLVSQDIDVGKSSHITITRTTTASATSLASLDLGRGVIRI